MIPSAVFVLAVALQMKYSLSSKFLRNLESKDLYTGLFTSRKHKIGSLMKALGSVAGVVLKAAKSLYFCSEVSFCVMGVKSQPFNVGVGLQQGGVLSPLLFIVYMSG